MSKLIDRFKRAWRYRKWSILLFPLTMPVSSLLYRLMAGAWPVDAVRQDIFLYLGMVVIVTMVFMLRDDYKELKE